MVPALFANKAIDLNYFTLRLSDKQSSSWIEFGTPNGGGVDTFKYAFVTGGA